MIRYFVVQEYTINQLVGAAFGAAGQRCMALTTAVVVGEAKNWIPEVAAKAAKLKLSAGKELKYSNPKFKYQDIKLSHNLAAFQAEFFCSYFQFPRLTLHDFVFCTLKIWETVCTKTVHWESPRIIRVFSRCTLGNTGR